MFYARYLQWGRELKLRSEISKFQNEISPSEKQKNFAILCSSKKSSLRDEMSRTKRHLRENGVVIVRSDIPDSIWY